MKRVLSFLLCIVMCFSIFSVTAAEVYALGAADKLFTVRESFVKDKRITYTINLASGLEGFGGAVLLVEFDNSVLKPVECGPALTSNGTQQMKGLYTYGVSEASDNVYSVAYTNNSPEKTTAVTPFFTMTFEVVDSTHPATAISFYCKEYYSTTDSEQSITVADGLQLIKNLSDVTTLEAPVLSGAQLGTGNITLTWKAAEGANGYIIRRESTNSGREIVAEVSADVLGYVDTNLTSGETYTYFVQSANGDSISLYDSTGVSCKYVAKPKVTSAVNGVGGVEIQWEATAGADSYVIMRRESGETEWQKLVTRSAASTLLYKDTNVENGKTYEYDVNSVLGSFVTESLEEGVKVTYLESPTISSVANTDDGIEISWKALENAAYYVVYRKEAGVDTELKEYATVTTNSFLDNVSDVTAGKAYTYSVQAVSDYGESAVSKTGYTITRVPSTVVTDMVTGTDNITVFWQSVEGVDGYHIYRKTELSSWEKVGTSKGEVLVYKDTSVVSDNEYYYAAVPYIGNSEGAKVSSDFKLYYLAAPGTVVADNTKDAIKVTWQASDGALYYNVLRKVGEKDDFYLVKTVNAGEVLEYVDYDTVEDSIYYYSVQAFSAAGESKTSDITPATMRIECVKGLKTYLLSSGVELSWKIHPSADSYIVCRKEGDTWYEIAEVADEAYIDTDIVSGNTYAYAVKPVVSGFKGGIDEDSIKSLKYLAAPTGVTVTNTASASVIKWKGVSGARNYEIYKVKLDSKGNLSGSYSKLATLKSTVLQYTDKKISAGQKYRYIVYTTDNSVKSAASTACDNVFLTVPTVKLANAYGGAKVSWNAVKGAAKYRVYRKLSTEKSWVKIADVSGSTLSYLDKTVKGNTKVSYTVRAQNGNSLSTYKGVTFTYYAAPTLTLKNTGSAINLSWKAVSGAKSYYIYRKAPGESKWTKISTVTKTSYNDKNVKNGKTYTYTIKAYTGKVTSGYKAAGWSIKRLAAPKLVSIANSASGVKITWGKVSGASSYIVYRKLNGDTSWTRLADNIKTTSYNDKTAKAGKTYIYTVVAVGSGYRSSYYSGLKIKRLARPELVSAKSSKSGITVKWGETTGASGYYVYRKTGSSSWSRIATVKGKTTVSYLDKTAKKGVTYTYTVRAYSGSSGSSYYSGISCKDKY